MKKWQRRILFILPLTLLTGLFLPACVSATPQERTADGVKMDYGEFERYFYEGTLPAVSAAAPRLTMSSINYESGSRALIVTGGVLTGDGSDKAFALTGTLYNSYKKLDGLNNMSAILEDTLGNFDVLLFNVFHSDEPAPFLFNAAMEHMPHLKLYMTDRETGEFYFFETEIPRELADISIPLADDTICPDMLHDMIWFGNVIEPEIAFLENPDEPSSAIYFNTVSVTWPSANGPYRCFTTPMLLRLVGDVKGTDSAIWGFDFSTSNVYCLDPADTRYDLAAIRIKEVQIAFTAGTYTCLSQYITHVGGRLLGGLDPAVHGKGSPISGESDRYVGYQFKMADDQYIQHDFNTGVNIQFLNFNFLALKDPDHQDYTGTAEASVYVQYKAELGTTTVTSPGETAVIAYNIT